MSYLLDGSNSMEVEKNQTKITAKKFVHAARDTLCAYAYN